MAVGSLLELIINDIIPFDFDEHPVRVIMCADQPWFVANDVAKVLGYRDAANMVRVLDEDEKGTHNMSTLGGEQALTIISESGLYAVILKSRREEAKRFRKWVTQDVLPTLRRTGTYHLHDSPPLQPFDFDHIKLTASVAVVREARRLWGQRTARNVWMQLGLPVCIAEASGMDDADPLAPVIRDWLHGRGDVTISEVAAGIGISGDIDGSTRQRIGRILRLLGWQARKVRRGQYTVNAFTGPINWTATTRQAANAVAQSEVHHADI